MKISSKKKTGWIIAGIVAISITFFSFSQDEKNFQLAKSLDIYYTLFRELNLFYVDEVNPGDLVKTSIDKMLESLDPYTNFISEDDMEDFRFMTTGEYAGIGALISRHGDKIVIAEPYEGFPAQKYGLKAGDIILEVAGKQTINMNTEDVSNLLKGAANTTVLVKVQRYGQPNPMEFNIVREKIQIDPVPYYGMLDQETGYIRLANFTANCSENVKAALMELKNKHKAKSLILDLRSNPGGLLMEAVKITNFFVGKGEEIVSTRGKVKQWDKTYVATANPIDTVIPLAVLVNRGSASASEIVAGALQDLDRAIVIGDRTFGKGLVQTTRDLSYNTKLKVTTAKYYIPSGRCIQALDYSHRNEDGSVGFIPDSLITEFSTKKGRKVYDGGGVVPDKTIESERMSNLAISLVSQLKIFDFATKFSIETPSIPQPEEFTITDAIYNDFMAYVEAQGVDYDSQTEQEFQRLLEVAKREKYYDVFKDEFDVLKNKLGHDLSKDMLQFRDEISDLLTDEIVSRFYFQKGAIRSAIGKDKGIEKARLLLQDPTAYRTAFAPGTVIARK